MLLDATLHFTDVILDLVVDTSAAVVSLNEVDLSLLSKQRATILPLRWVILWTVKIAWELGISARCFDEWNAEGMTKVLPDPFAFGV